MKKPNVIIILTDDHGYGDVTGYGGPNIQTPNLDGLIRDGMKFTRFYANSPVCSPSRASLMTGRYPDMVGVPGVIRTHETNSWGYFDTGAVTLPEMMNRAGYRSTIIGKWHLGLEPENHPCSRGFDSFRGFLGDMMDDYYTHLRHGNNYMRREQETIDPAGHATDIFTDWAVEEIENHAAGDKPLFLYLAYNAPHTPIQPPEEWFERVRKREPEISDQRARYVALVEQMDAGVGRVVEALKASGTYENTLLVYCSDNGGQLDVGAYNGEIRGAKQEMYEGGIRVPMMAVWPGRIEAGSVSSQMGMIMDLFPTACEAAGVAVSHEIDGHSILPTLLGEEQDFSSRLYYWVRREGGRKYFGQDYHAVRRGDLKLLHNTPFDPLELFDMDGDEKETTDLAGSDPAALEELIGEMQERVRRSGAIPWRKRPETDRA
jgi:arylsulfatase A-like enzyme